MDRQKTVRKKWGRRFLLLLGCFIVGIFGIGAVTSEDNFLVFYQPVFFLFVVGFPLLIIGHDVEMLREPDPLGEGGSEKLASFVPVSQNAVVGFGRGILKARIAGAVVILLAVLPEAGGAYWRLLQHLF